MRPALIKAALASGAVFAAAAIAAAFFTIVQYGENARLVGQALDVLGQIEAVRGEIYGAWTAQQRYISPGEEAAALEYARRKANAEREIGELLRIVAIPEQKERARRLGEASERLFALLDASVEQRRRDSVSTVQPTVEDRIAEAMGEVQRIAGEFVARGRSLQQERRARAESEARFAIALISFAGAFALAQFFAAALMLGRFQRQRDRALAELAAVEQRLKMALDGSDLAVWDWDGASDSIYLSEAWSGIVGGAARATATSSKALAALVHPDDLDKVRAALAAVHEGGQDSYSVEHRVRTAHGTYRWINSRGRVVARDARGAATRMVGTNADITLRKSVEEALAASEARFRSLTALSADWYWEQDEHFRFVDFSKEAPERDGSAPGTHIGKTRWELPFAGVTEKLWAEHRAVLEAHRAFRDFEYQRVTPRGEVIWLSVSGEPIMDSEGRFKGYRGTGHNITERKRVEEALRESEQRFRGAFELGLIGMALASPEKGLVEVNDAFCRMLGRSREQLIGTSWLHYARPEDVAKNEAVLARTLAGETDTCGMETRFVRPDGGTVDAEIAARCIRNADGSVRHFVLLVQDLTERKRLDRMKDEFVATVSHELRTPLTSIRASLSMLAGGIAGEINREAAKLIEISHNSCERLVRLVNDLLDFQRLRADRLKLEVRPVDAVELARQAIAANEGYARERGASLQFRAPDSPRTILADHDAFMQVATNLISNAVKFSPRGAAVEVAVEDGDGVVRVSVRDHGPGIPASFRPQIFQQFSRAARLRARTHGGTGLGLAISKGLVEKLGGRIGFESEEGAGSVFWFDLPAAQVASESDALARVS